MRTGLSLFCAVLSVCSWLILRASRYPYCSIEHLSHHYRSQLQLKEIEAYSPDVLCLQECGDYESVLVVVWSLGVRKAHVLGCCDHSRYKEYFSPLLWRQGYESVLSLKTGAVPEGIVTAWRRKRVRR